MRFAFIILASLGQALAQQPPGEALCSISGQAIRADSGEPIRRATITARSTETRTGNVPSGSTGSDGRFEIKGLKPGQYRITASRNGFLSQEYGQKAYGRPGVAVTLTGGQAANDISFRMVASGALSGRVVNEDGERLAYVHVQAFRQTRVQGRRQWAPVGMANTNDLGEYRIFGLAPGVYYLAAQYTSGSVRPVAASNPSERSTAEESYAPCYYPGSLDPTRASPVELTPGGDLRGIDFNLAPTRSVRIRGRVKFDAGENRSNPFLNLFPRNATFIGFMGRHSASVDQNGEFEMRGVTPGSYWLTADQVDRTMRQTARIPLEVGSNNIDDINLVLGASPELPGRFRSGSGVDLSRFKPRVLLQNSDGSLSAGASAEVKPDGSFLIQDVSPDSYALTVIGLPADVWIQSVRLGDADLTSKLIDLTSGAGSPLEISLASGAAQITGSVVRQQQPAPGAVVVLVPDGERRRLARFFKTAVTDQNGAFVIKGIAPGEYRLFAWDELEDGIYQDPDFLQAFESKGKTISLNVQAQESVQLEVLTGGLR